MLDVLYFGEEDWLATVPTAETLGLGKLSSAPLLASSSGGRQHPSGNPNAQAGGKYRRAPRRIHATMRNPTSYGSRYSRDRLHTEATPDLFTSADNVQNIDRCAMGYLDGISYRLAGQSIGAYRRIGIDEYARAFRACYFVRVNTLSKEHDTTLKSTARISNVIVD